LPGTHAPPLQLSPLLHGLPSSHGALLATLVQPVLGSQASLVHRLPSSHSSALPLVQTPPWQVSPTLQTEPSASHGCTIAVCWQPLCGRQVSAVHGFRSSQAAALPPLQAPPAQLSASVHAEPSSQPLPSAAATAAHWPVLAWHTACWHGAGLPPQTGTLPATTLQAQLAGGPLLSQASLPLHRSPSSGQSLSCVQAHTPWPAAHLPSRQVSPLLHGLPSSHGPLLGACWQPWVGSQLSAVHGFWSSQALAAPLQPPPLHRSGPLQALPSSQATAPLGWLAQPCLGSQKSSVQAMPSSQLLALPAQIPPRQASAVVQGKPSSHGVVSGALL
jgi:hypothetical protein